MFDAFDVLGEPEKAENWILEILMLDFLFCIFISYISNI